MSTSLRRPRRAARLVPALGIGIALLAGREAAAYALNKASTCSPGAHWDTATPVKVRLMVDSFLYYADGKAKPSAKSVGDAPLTCRS